MIESITTKQIDDEGDGTPEEREPATAAQQKGVGRKEKRKLLKKEKRKQIRKELAERARAEEEARLNDPEEQRRIQLEEEREKERMERDRKELEERERIFLEELERKKKAEEEEEERREADERESKQNQAGLEQGSNEDDEWEYVEEGPPEIIWQGNEIIVKKNKVRVKKKDLRQHNDKEDPNRPTSNPLPPQSQAYAAFKNTTLTSAQLLDNVAQQVPNFGTEQDKAHCPFHIKTGACRFGSRCNRVHYYPDKSCTLLIKNMYSGPGLAWEQDEGLEYTDEEVERSYEEFYEDVHTEFLKFGEIVNFKVCRNGSFHLRGNVYVHYKSLDSAMMAYNSVNGRYFAGKQVKCEFVSVDRWKVAICGEYIKSRLKTCSRGTACNFLHCFSNPGGDYEWADCDKPPPRYWVKKMTALFGYSDEACYDKQMEQPSPRDRHYSSRRSTSDRDSFHSKRYFSRETDAQSRSSSRSRHHEEDDVRKSRRHERQGGGGRKQLRSVDEDYEEEIRSNIPDDTDSDQNWPDKEMDSDVQMRYPDSSRRSSRHESIEHKSGEYYSSSRRTRDGVSDEDQVSSRKSSRHERGESKSRDRHSRSRRSTHDGSSDEDQNSSRNGSRHERKESKSRDYYGGSRKRTHDSSSGEDFSKSEKDMERGRGHTRKRSRHKENASELSDDGGKSDYSKLEQRTKRRHPSSDSSEDDFPWHKEKKTDSKGRHQRTRRRHRDDFVDEVGHQESENESFSKKQKKRKSKDDYVAESPSSDRHNRGRSRDSVYCLDKKNDESDRWEPGQNTPKKDHEEYDNELSGEDHQQPDIRTKSYDHISASRNRKLNGRRSSSRERFSGSLEKESSPAEEFKESEETSGKSRREKQPSQKREKRKRI